MHASAPGRRRHRVNGKERSIARVPIGPDMGCCERGNGEAQQGHALRGSHVRATRSEVAR